MIDAVTERRRILVVAGPTGVGKTRVAVALARELDAEIVSADSMQVYRGMDIGTSKATAEERAAAPHHMLDVVDPDEDFHAARYRELATAALADIHSRGRRAILVGGTGLYIKILVRGIFEAPPVDQDLRGRYEQEAETYGSGALHDRLKLVDPLLAGRVNPNDRVRVIRALEVFDLTGIPLSQHQEAHGFADALYDTLTLGLRIDRAVLYERIEARVDQMLASGFADEVRRLLQAGFSADLRPMGALGYKQLCAQLSGELTEEEAIRRIKRETKRYAKRQLTWFQKDPAVRWFEEPFDVPAMAGLAAEHFEGANLPPIEAAP